LNNLLLKSYLRCKRKAWLDLWGEKSLKTWSAQQSINLITEFSNFNKFTDGDLFKGRKACEKGVKGVIGIKIRDKLKKDLNIEINPSLLIRTNGNSIWGKYKYLPAVSKLGRRTTREHQLDLALCSIFVERFQKAKIEYGLVISSQNNKIYTEKIFINKKLRDKVINLFFELNESLKYKIPNITENRKKCSICSWKKFCDKEAESNGFLTDIDGIGSKTAQSLKNVGINDVKQLASFDKSKLKNRLSINNENDFKKFNQIINQSKSYLSGLPIHRKSHKDLLDLLKKLKQGFYVFDIESNPDENHDFLYGLLSVENVYDQTENFVYKPILNLINKNKYNFEIFKQLNLRNNWPILHFGETEKITMIKMAKIINLNKFEIESLESRFIDLHLLIRNSWILPIKNYSLKTVASWVGFDWSQKNISGSKALYWWIQYSHTKENSFLEKILTYNKDDCLATLEIIKWHLDNAHKFLKES